MKTCTKCLHVKPFTDFFSRKGATDGKMSSCKVCKTAAIYAWREKNGEAARAYSREYRTRPNSKETRSRYSARPDIAARELEQARARRRTPDGKDAARRMELRPEVAAYRKAYRKQPTVVEKARLHGLKPEVRARANVRQMARYHSDAFTRLNRRMSTGVNQSIRKNHRTWNSLVGYSCAELMTHIERQFLKGMSWENYGPSWHIDHIIPVSSFSFKSYDDAEFQACWSLGNLRPLWAKENISKSNKRLFLI